jgi:uncharacterized protein YdhG (YjbR/CyaY superfamily)
VNTAKSFDSYVAAAPEEVRETLVRLRRVIKHAAPRATERISYRMPFYEYGGAGYKGRLIYFAAFKNHIGVFIPSSLSGAWPRELEKYRTAKAAFRFPLDRPFPFALIGKTVKALVKRRDAENVTPNRRAARSSGGRSRPVSDHL